MPAAAPRDGMSRLAEEILRQMQERRQLIESGQARFWRLFRRPVADDELVKLSPPIVDVTDAPDSAWPTVIDTRKHGDGQLWVTNRRAVVDSRGKVLREWAWEDLEEVRLIPGYIGVVVTPRAGETVTVLRQVVKDTAVMSKYAPYVRWLTVEASFAAATGHLDRWYAELPSRLSGSG